MNVNKKYSDDINKSLCCIICFDGDNVNVLFEMVLFLATGEDGASVSQYNIATGSGEGVVGDFGEYTFSA